MESKSENTPLNVLLADDNYADRFMFEKILKQISITTNLTAVIDGEQLMQYLAENSKHLPDILFLDITMPCKNGS